MKLWLWLSGGLVALLRNYNPSKDRADNFWNQPRISRRLFGWECTTPAVTTIAVHLLKDFTYGR